jgi:two-component system, sensor histidine kinase and response regulator
MCKEAKKPTKIATVLNWDRILGNVGDTETVVIILEAFINDTTKQINSLIGSLTTGNLDLITMKAHTIKGSSASVGGEAISEIAFIIEKASKAADLNSIKMLLPALQDCFEEFKKAVETKIKEINKGD